MDLGGSGRGAQKEENVFAIQTAVAIVTLYRKGSTRAAPATVRYQRLHGTRTEKLHGLAEVQPPSAGPDQWTTLDVTRSATLLPIAGSADWLDMPALTDLFPWQQPGVIFARSWPIAPSRDVLYRRWRALLSKTEATERATHFVTAASGRNIHTKVGDLPRLSELPNNAPSQEIIRYAYRSFDRQWTLKDPRLAALDRPSLWQSLSDHQFFLTTLATTPLGDGPALTVSTAVPDFHHFRGSYGGKDVIPLYRDAAAKHPNLPAGLLDVLKTNYSHSVSPEDVAAYVYAVLAHPAYAETFSEALQSPGPRVPLTADAELFGEAVALGERLLWLHTYAERYPDPADGRSGRVTPIAGVGWARSVTALPHDTSAISYDPTTRTLHVGDGAVTGVDPEVWDFSVSGYPVVQRWLGSRTATGIGRAASPRYATPLDTIRPKRWEDGWNDELLDLLRVLTHTVRMQAPQAELLARILDNSLIPTHDLPAPTPAERTVPPTL